MSETSNLGLAYVEAAQAQKHVTVNEAFRRLDALVQMAVIDRDLAAPPIAPLDGERYIVGPGANGGWAGHADHIAVFQDGGWVFFTPRIGWTAWVIDEGQHVIWSGAAWILSVSGAAPATVLQNLDLLGVGTTADATNPFSAKLPNALLTALSAAEGGSGDLRLKMNKEGQANILSLLMQSGWSGRAELGLAGDDDFRLKVSADGSQWSEAFSVDRTTGAVSFARGAMRAQAWIFTASGVWTKPDWARRVRVVAMGGGGGGGAGALRANLTICGGGASGNPGLYVIEEYVASDVPASLAVTVGQGGQGAPAVSAAGGNGADGSPGEHSFFGALLCARGGGGGKGGSGTGGAAPGSEAAYSTYGQQSLGGAGGTGAAGGSATFAMSGVAPTAGGGGGGINGSDTPFPGGSGAQAYLQGDADSVSAAGAGGAVGTAGLDGADKAWPGGAGAGGGGGGASASANAGGGGKGGLPAAAGGGGGAGRDGFLSGQGGDGARGEVRVYCYG